MNDLNDDMTSVELFLSKHMMKNMLIRGAIESIRQKELEISVELIQQEVINLLKIIETDMLAVIDIAQGIDLGDGPFSTKDENDDFWERRGIYEYMVDTFKEALKEGFPAASLKEYYRGLSFNRRDEIISAVQVKLMPGGSS